MLTKLTKRIVDKPWGRTGAGAAFGADAKRQVGEIWFEAPPRRPLAVMAKYLFTSERLSVQVHPDDETARSRGLPSGKDECWIILDADDDAELGIGTTREVSTDELLASARDGSIVELVDWRRPQPGELIVNPAGTVHALGAGLTVLEIQQAVDVTYRLHDYGRDRPLHLEEAIDVVVARPHFHPLDRLIDRSRSAVLVGDAPLGVAWCHREPPALPATRELQLLPIDAPVVVGGESVEPGECALFDGDPAKLRSNGNFVLAWSSVR